MGYTMRPSSEEAASFRARLRRLSLSINSGIETADSADFTDFEGVIGDERTNLFVAKLQGIDHRNLTYCIRVIWVICG
jgi:hypothetical protein